MEEAATFAAAAQVVEDDVEEEDVIMLEDVDDKLEEKLSNEVTFAPKDEAPPYELDVEDFWERIYKRQILF